MVFAYDSFSYAFFGGGVKGLQHITFVLPPFLFRMKDATVFDGLLMGLVVIDGERKI